MINPEITCAFCHKLFCPTSGAKTCPDCDDPVKLLDRVLEAYLNNPLGRARIRMLLAEKTVQLHLENNGDFCFSCEKPSEGKML